MAPGGSRRGELSAKTNKQPKKAGEVEKKGLFSSFCCKQWGRLIFQKGLIGPALMRSLPLLLRPVSAVTPKPKGSEAQPNEREGDADSVTATQGLINKGCGKHRVQKR